MKRPAESKAGLFKLAASQQISRRQPCGQHEPEGPSSYYIRIVFYWLMVTWKLENSRLWIEETTILVFGPGSKLHPLKYECIFLMRRLESYKI